MAEASWGSGEEAGVGCEYDRERFLALAGTVDGGTCKHRYLVEGIAGPFLVYCVLRGKP
jgi:hypothetical protein